VTQKEDVRSKLLEIIKNNPGLHFRALQRESGLAIGQLEYHLYRLERDDEIVKKKDGRYKRFFPIAGADNTVKALSLYLRNKNSRAVLLLLLRKGKCSEDKISSKVKNLEILKPLLDSMVGERLLERDEKMYSLRNPSSLKEFLKKSRKSFLDELSESLIELLDEENEN
jgi:hypothetical protein